MQKYSDFMKKYAFLLGDAPQGFCQKKICSLYEQLLAEKSQKSDGRYEKQNVCAFPNGINELALEYGLGKVFDECSDCDSDSNSDCEESSVSVLLYICTQKALGENTETVLVGGHELRMDVLSYYANLAEKCGIAWQCIFEADGELVSEGALGYEAV